MSYSAFLFALQLSDSALPTGRFAHSYALEEFVTREPELGEQELQELVETMLVEVVAPLDGVALAEAHRLSGRADVEALIALDHAVTARKITPSSRHASTTCGRRLAALVPTLTADKTASTLVEHIARGAADGNIAVVEGVVTRALGIDSAEAVLIELRAASGAMLSAAVRLGRISASRSQALATALVPTLCSALEVVAGLEPTEMRAVGPELDLASIWHGNRDGKLFVT
jgi:urease accessory protein